MYEFLVMWPRVRFVLWNVTARIRGFQLFPSFEYLRDEMREHFIVHKLKTEWIFSGVRQDDKGYFSEIGIIRSGKKLNRAQAIRYTVNHFPRATIKHIDDRNKIITYAVSG